MNIPGRTAALGLLFCVALVGACSSAESAGGGIQLEAETRPRTDTPVDDKPDHFHFVIMSDRTGGHRPGVFSQGVDKVNLLRPPFVMCVGDLIEGYTEDEAELDRQWDEFEEMVERLTAPFFHVPGNHDISNEVMRRKWEERFGRPYYHFVYRNVLFLCLNTENPPPSHISDAQADYVARTLAENDDVRWTLVFMHKPLWLEAPEPNTGWPKVEELLDGRPYTVFAGHHHTYVKYVRNDRNYIKLATTGGASGMGGPAFGQFDHVVWVTMTDDGPQLANLMLDGIHDENVSTEESIDQTASIVSNSWIRPQPVFVDYAPVPAPTTSRIDIANNTAFPMKAAASVAPHLQVTPRPHAFEVTLAPNERRNVNMELLRRWGPLLEGLPPVFLNWTISHDIPGRPALVRTGSSRIGIVRVEYCLRRQAPLVVDGRLNEWPDLPIVCRRPEEIRPGPEDWDGAEDCSFRFGVAYDDEYLYLAVETTDDASVTVPGKEPWEQDGIEVRLDARPGRVRSQHTGGGEFEEVLFLSSSPAQTAEEAVLFQQDRIPEGVKAVCVRTETGHNTEIAVPVGYLDEAQGAEWEGFRLNIAVDDFDAPEGPGVQVWWRPDWRRFLNYPGSGTFRRL